MSKAEDGVEEISPPPNGDASDGKTTPIDGTSRDSHVEQLSFELKQLKLQRKIASSRGSSRILKAENWLFLLHQMKRLMLHSKKPRAREEEREIRNPTTLLPLTMITCLPLAPSLRYPLVKAHHFYGTDYTNWKYSMKMHLTSLNPSVCTIVRTGVEFLDEDEEPDFDQLQQIHRNAQASSVLLSSLEKDEFDRVNVLEKAKDIWDTLQRAHEGTKPVKKAKRQLIEGQLDRFVMLDDEDPQEMYNQQRSLSTK
jgi:hypothetical protein